MQEIELSSIRFSKKSLIFIVLFVSALVFVIVFDWWININIIQTTYLSKAGMDWWNDVFLLRGDLLTLCFLLPLLTIDPRITRCKILGFLRYIYWRISWIRLGHVEERMEKVFDDKFSFKTGLIYQIFTYSFFFLLALATQAFGLALPFHMARNGVGCFDLQTISRIFLFPINPPTVEELVALTPTIETWYLMIVTLLTIVFVLWMIRLIIGGVGAFMAGSVGRGLRGFSASASLLILMFLLRAPYGKFDVTSPHTWGILITLELLSIMAIVVFHIHRESLTINRRQVLPYITVFGLVSIILVANVGFIMVYRLQWDRSWLQYEWYPKTTKEIEYTRWTTGISGWQHLSLSEIGSTNNTEILSKIRQWDFEASLTKMKSQIGVNWLTLADSDILYLNNQEYWVCPTKINYNIASDWISRRFIYTNTPRVIVIDSHTGEFVQPENAFNLSKIPLIYYGEGFEKTYVQVPGFTEIGDVTYQEEPDYVLTGFIRAWWFLKEGQLGFVLNPPKDDIALLWNRDVKERVKTILLNHLTVDDDVYLVTDGERLYYCVQVFIDYPLSSGFSKRGYMRFLGVITVDVENGNMKGYSVDESDGFLLDFYKSFYNWQPIPAWLRSQMRVPETFYENQLEVDYRYHVSDSTVWRSNSDDFERPVDTDVNYILVTKDENIVFVAVQVVEYRRATGLNLAGLYTALCGTEYGNVFFYRVPPEQRLIGPSAARQAFETNTVVRTQLSLLRTYRFGNILLYNIQGEPYYFIPVYSEVTAGEAVIVKLAFIGCVDASTGEEVSMGTDALSAYNALAPSPVVGEDERLTKMYNLFITEGIAINEATMVRGDIEHLEALITYSDESMWEETQTNIKDFIDNTCKPKGVDEVYSWLTIHEGYKYVNYGFIVINEHGLRILYYIQIKY